MYNGVERDSKGQYMYNGVERDSKGQYMYNGVDFVKNSILSWLCFMHYFDWPADYYCCCYCYCCCCCLQIHLNTRERHRYVHVYNNIVIIINYYY